MPMTKEERETEYQRGLELTRRYGPYVLQRRDSRTGEWRNIGRDIEGHEEATRVLEEEKQEMYPEESPHDIRVLPKNEADKLREGIRIGKKIAGVEEERAFKIPSGMYLPEHL